MKKSFLYLLYVSSLLIYHSSSLAVSLGDAMEAAENGIHYCNGRPLPAGQRTCNYGNTSVDVYSEQRRQLSEYQRALIQKAFEPADGSSSDSTLDENIDQ